MAHCSLYYLFPALILLLRVSVTAGDPQTNLLNVGCSQYNATPSSIFLSALNETLDDLSAAAGQGFATASRPRAAAPVYALLQCRPYLSAADCLACFGAAAARLRKCGAANGARAIYDGCILRYESAAFFDQTTLPGNTAICSGKAANEVGFAAAAVGLVTDLEVAVPRIKGFAAAVERDGVYAAAQCVETVSEEGCGNCLQVAVGNIQGCPPDKDGRAVDAGCFLRYSDTAFFGTNQTVDLTPFLESGDILGATELQGPLTFNYKDLKTATNNFSEQNKLGEGGFGDVYKGTLKNGKIVAVKKLAIAQTSRAKADFQSEVKLISNVHHRNLVRLLGCSSKGLDLLLVYEYMANSSLDKFLFGDRRGTLNWKQRFDIIVGMARGLAYLHQEFHVCIIHRDIKSSNILLDGDFQPKIADFGLARLLPDDHSHLSTKFAGTLGYTAPEYAIHGQLSEKVDTYSYGVVVLEIISGRKSNDVKLEPITQYLLEWAWKLYETNELMELVDKSLEPNEFPPSEVQRIIHIALLCTQSTVAARPTMSEVVLMLLSRGESLLQPTRPTFIDATSRVRGDTSSSNSSSSVSKATVSVSQFSGR
ncbi:cysteine-rich receptor-like protein kinase 44 isoform X2 [Typha angustifolia]|uniref:cysteine-rich receptor-like protein kinase 44 isoform X2 n=1 Tax=Typha angustifolia TaxID=59011 RepID=UPI003C301168